MVNAVKAHANGLWNGAFDLEMSQRTRHQRDEHSPAAAAARFQDFVGDEKRFGQFQFEYSGFSCNRSFVVYYKINKKQMAQKLKWKSIN